MIWQHWWNGHGCTYAKKKINHKNRYSKSDYNTVGICSLIWNINLPLRLIHVVHLLKKIVLIRFIPNGTVRGQYYVLFLLATKYFLYTRVLCFFGVEW